MQEDEAIAQQAAMAQAKFGAQQVRKPANAQDVSAVILRVAPYLTGFAFSMLQKKKFDSADYFGSAYNGQAQQPNENEE